MKRFGFPRQARILRERDFRRVYRCGRRFAFFPLRFCVLARQDGASRLGLAVSRKVGNAPTRNRWKRAIREAFRLERSRIRPPHDVVVSVNWDATPGDVARVPAAFEALIAWLQTPPQAEGQR